MPSNPGFELWYCEVMTEFGQEPDGVHVLEQIEQTFGPEFLECIPKWIPLNSNQTHQGICHHLLVWWPVSQSWEELEKKYPKETHYTPEVLKPIAWLQNHLGEPNNLAGDWVYSFPIADEVIVLRGKEEQIQQFWRFSAEEFQSFQLEFPNAQSVPSEELKSVDVKSLNSNFNAFTLEHVRKVQLETHFKTLNYVLGLLVAVFLSMGFYFKSQSPVIDQTHNQSHVEFEKHLFDVSRKMSFVSSNDWQQRLKEYDELQSKVNSKIGLRSLRVQKDELRLVLQLKSWEDYELLQDHLKENMTLSKGKIKKSDSILANLKISPIKNEGSP